MIRFVRYASIAANVLFAVFLSALIKNQAGTLRWVHSVNQFWFFLVLVGVITVAAALAELSARPKAEPATAPSHEGDLRPAA